MIKIISFYEGHERLLACLLVDVLICFPKSEQEGKGKTDGKLTRTNGISAGIPRSWVIFINMGGFRKMELFDKTGNSRRRDFLKVCFLTGAAMALPMNALASVARKRNPKEKILTLYNPNTGEYLKEVPFWKNGFYLPSEITEINRFCRDFRNDEITHIDQQLLDMLYDIRQYFPSKSSRIILVSAYRSPETNALLRKTGHNVAKNSYHMEGKAFDVRIEGVSLANLRKAALRYGRGGVGYYPRSGFVHIDTGPVRSW
jgi:uncharacterized protein YcbK (DUF882 family)